MNRFKDKISIITGGASGIGRALGEELARRGAKVILTDINAEGIEQVAASIRAAGGRANGKELDVTNARDVEKLIQETATEFGRLDYIFNNAGIAVLGEARDTDLEQWRRVIDVNLWGVINGTLTAYKLMAKQGFGHIVNTASVAGLFPSALETSYTASKYGVVGMSKSMRCEGADLGVKVSVVCPGFIRTAIYDVSPVMNSTMEEFLGQIPDGVMMDVDKAARVIWWIEKYFPSLMALFLRKSIKNFRKIRREE